MSVSSRKTLIQGGMIDHKRSHMVVKELPFLMQISKRYFSATHGPVFGESPNLASRTGPLLGHSRPSYLAQ